MSTFKNVSGHPVDIPLFGVHVADGDTVDVPDEVDYSFDNNPAFQSSKVKNADIAVPDDVADAAFPFPEAIPPMPPVVAPDAPPTGQNP